MGHDTVIIPFLKVVESGTSACVSCVYLYPKMAERL